MTDTYHRAVAILIDHQRISPNRCGCGPLVLGSSWAEHVADELLVSGVLREEAR